VLAAIVPSTNSYDAAGRVIRNVQHSELKIGMADLCIYPHDTGLFEKPNRGAVSTH
jgi:hypothetical protein